MTNIRITGPYLPPPALQPGSPRAAAPAPAPAPPLGGQRPPAYGGNRMRFDRQKVMRNALPPSPGPSQAMAATADFVATGKMMENASMAAQADQAGALSNPALLGKIIESLPPAVRQRLDSLPAGQRPPVPAALGLQGFEASFKMLEQNPHLESTYQQLEQHCEHELQRLNGYPPLGNKEAMAKFKHERQLVPLYEEIRKSVSGSLLTVATRRERASKWSGSRPAQTPSMLPSTFTPFPAAGRAPSPPPPSILPSTFSPFPAGGRAPSRPSSPQPMAGVPFSHAQLPHLAPRTPQFKPIQYRSPTYAQPRAPAAPPSHRATGYPAMYHQPQQRHCGFQAQHAYYHGPGIQQAPQHYFRRAY